MRGRIVSYIIIFIGAWLRIHAQVQDVRLESDEAWFSTFARAAALNGDWWLPGPLDKPPLAIYLNALAQALVGDSEFGARLASTLAGILLIPVMIAVMQAWYQDTPRQKTAIALLAGILTALSPFAIVFSATAYTDSLMLLAMTVALWMAGRNHWGWAGFWLVISIASKPQGIFYLPLVLALGWAAGELSARRLLRLSVGFGIAGALLLIWDFARPGTSVFALAAVHNDPTRLIRANEIVPRLHSWLEQSGFLLGPGWLTLTLVIISVFAVILRVIRQPRQRNTFIDMMLLNFVVAFALIHGLLAFNTFDRYLLPLLPPLILLAARAIVAFRPSRRLVGLVSLMVSLALLPTAFNASDYRTPLSSARQQYTGIDGVAAFLNAQPVATVIYDHWMGWELGYYLGQWHDKRVVYYPDPQTLVRDALRLCEIGPRYFPVPTNQSPRRWLEALQQAHFQVEIAFDNGQYVIYRLTPPWQHVDDCSG